MKNYIFLTVLFLSLITQKTNSQCTASGNGGPPADYLGFNNNQTLNFATNTTPQMTLTTGGDLNIIGGANGYMIGNNYMLWNNNYTNNIYVGVGAGNATATGQHNTMAGFGAGHNLTNAGYNTFTGTQAGYYTTGGAFPAGTFNTMTGYECGYFNDTGHTNCYYGKLAAAENKEGNYNCMYGAHSGDGHASHSVDSNSFFGTYSNYYGTIGQDNVYIGMDAALKSGDAALGYIGSNYNVYIGGLVANINQSGNYNIVVGYKADAYSKPCVSCAPTGPIYNACALGAESVVLDDNSFILGNNSQNIGIGMSDIFGGPSNKLEISYFSAYTGPEPCTIPSLTSTFTTSCSAAAQSGASGLQFRDLTFGSTPFPNYTNNFLTLDDAGNVVLMQTPQNGIGYCTALTPMTADGGYNLSNNNFLFSGNAGGTAANNVIIGQTCPISYPKGKLSVYQNSTSVSGSTGFYVENDDGIPGYNAEYNGVVSMVPAPALSSSCIANCAGYFEADGLFDGCSATAWTQYALFVPPGGGGESIGWPYGGPYNDITTLFQVNSGILATTYYYPSDSILKKNVAPLKHGLDVIRKIQPISYKYNGVAGIDTFGTNYGLLAQALQRVAPYAVSTMMLRLDTSKTTVSPVLKIDNNAVLYTAINAIKQLDSIVTVKVTKIDSLTQTVDSLRNAFKNIQNCLNQLCGNGHSRIRNNNGSGNNEDSNATITNVENVTLSDVNAYLLYQNIPNPFSTSTKINYYLPEGTQGAYIVFYDNYGNQMKQVQLSQTGNGTLNISPDNLSNGIYSYSLVVNGKVIDTKRMLLQK